MSILKSFKLGNVATIVTIFAIGLGVTAVSSASAANVARNSKFVTKGIKATAKVDATFTFDAHPKPQTVTKPKPPHLLSVADPIYSTDSKPIGPDEHGSTGSGTALWAFTQLNDFTSYGINETVTATVKPNCPPNDKTCGLISFTTTTNNGTTITADGNEIPLQNQQLQPQAIPLPSQLTFEVYLGSKTELSLNETGQFFESIGLGSSNNLIYNLDFGIVLEDPLSQGDPLKKYQKVVAKLTLGIDDSNFALSFDNDQQTIENHLINAFTYDLNQNLWTANQDTYLFSVTVSNLQGVTSANLEGGISATDPDIEPVPEPLTMLGSATALGFGAFFKRKLKPSKSSEKKTTKLG